MDGHSYSQLSTKQLCPSMDGRGLSMAPLDISANTRVILIFSPSPTHELYRIKTMGVETS